MAGNDRKIVILQDRDMRLLRELAVMRVIDREQAKIVAGFSSTTRANTRLHALTKAGFLRRFFWGTVGGARKGLYSLSGRGAACVGAPDRGPRRSHDEVLAADNFTMHQLGVNDLYCVLKHKALPPGVEFVWWTGFHEPIDGTALMPDGYAGIEFGGKILALFLESDRGTENRKAWQEKVRQYLAFAASGKFAALFSQPHFRTLVVVQSESRLTSLRTATAALTEKIFRFTTSERIERETLWGAIWQKPTGDQRQTLF